MNVWPLQKDCDAFYGNPRGINSTYDVKWADANLTHVTCPWPLHMGKITVPKITIHVKCADSLARVLGNIWDALAHDYPKIQTLKYDQYSGSFNYRPMRGGSALSMHSYGVAIDWDDQDNLQHAKKHLFQDDSLLVVKFKEEGWIWGGDWGGSSIDSMHVQAALVHP